MKYEPRNKALDFIIDHTPENQNTLILVSRIEKHLKPVIEHLEKKYPDKEVHVIYGQTEALDRERIRSLIEKKTNLIIVATYQTLSTGFNVKNLHQIVFFSSYKAKIKILQSVGRGLRTHESKDQLIVFDVVDDLSYKSKSGKVYFNYLVEHFFQRKGYYDNQGFTHLNKIIRL
jgi:type I site-specific restriction endonuclease